MDGVDHPEILFLHTYAAPFFARRRRSRAASLRCVVLEHHVQRRRHCRRAVFREEVGDPKSNVSLLRHSDTGCTNSVISEIGKPNFLFQ